MTPFIEKNGALQPQGSDVLQGRHPGRVISAVTPITKKGTSAGRDNPKNVQRTKTPSQVPAHGLKISEKILNPSKPYSEFVKRSFRLSSKIAVYKTMGVV